MLLLDRNNQPQNTIYYLSAISHSLIKQFDGLDYYELYNMILKERKGKELNNDFFTLALDFLFLLKKISIDKKGGLHVIKNVRNYQQDR